MQKQYEQLSTGAFGDVASTFDNILFCNSCLRTVLLLTYSKYFTSVQAGLNSLPSRIVEYTFCGWGMALNTTIGVRSKDVGIDEN